MPYEHESRMLPINAQEVLKNQGVVPGDVVIQTQDHEVHAEVLQHRPEGLPLPLTGFARGENGEPEEDLVIKAVGNAIDPEAAGLTMLLRREPDPNTGEVVLSALSPNNVVVFSSGETLPDAA